MPDKRKAATQLDSNAANNARAAKETTAAKAKLAAADFVRRARATRFDQISANSMASLWLIRGVEIIFEIGNAAGGSDQIDNRS